VTGKVIGIVWPGLYFSGNPAIATLPLPLFTSNDEWQAVQFDSRGAPVKEGDGPEADASERLVVGSHPAKATAPITMAAATHNIFMQDDRFLTAFIG
jgi:hypothetical protein